MPPEQLDRVLADFRELASERRFMLQSVLVRKLRPEHETLLPRGDPRDASREQLEACYPMLSAFLAEKRRCDSAKRLQNAWFQQVRAKLRCERCEVRWEK